MIWLLTWSSAQSIATSLWPRPAPFLAMYAAKMAEDRKFYNDKKSSHPVSSKYGGGHVLVPFARWRMVAHWVLMPWRS